MKGRARTDATFSGSPAHDLAETFHDTKGAPGEKQDLAVPVSRHTGVDSDCTTQSRSVVIADGTAVIVVMITVTGVARVGEVTPELSGRDSAHGRQRVDGKGDDLAFGVFIERKCKKRLNVRAVDTSRQSKWALSCPAW